MADEGRPSAQARPGTPPYRRSYPPDSVHGLVSSRLAEYAERLRAFTEQDAEAGDDGPKRKSRP